MGKYNKDAQYIKNKFIEIALVNSTCNRNIVKGRGIGKEKKKESNNLSNIY